MGVKRRSSGPERLGYGLVALAATGSGMALRSFGLAIGLLLLTAAGYAGSRFLGRPGAHSAWPGILIRLFIPGALVLLFLSMPYASKGAGADMALAGLLAAELLLLLNAPRSGAAPGQAGLVATGHMIFITATAREGSLIVILLLFAMVSIPFWHGVEAASFVARRRREVVRTGETIQQLPVLSIFGIAVTAAALLFILAPRPLSGSETAGAAAGATAQGAAQGPAGSSPALDPDAIRKMRTRRAGFSEEVVLAGATGRQPAEGRVLTLRCYREDGTPYAASGLLYIRGLTLDRYENGRWSHGLAYQAVRDIEDADLDGWTDTCFPEARGRTMVLQDIALEPIDSAAVFALPEPASITAREILTDFAGTVMFTRPTGARRRYQAVSQWGFPDREALGRMRKPVGRPEFVALPHGFEPVRKLALDLTAGVSTLLGICTRIERFLEENCAYSLEGMPSDSRDPVEVFLFDLRTGCCIDFASAMVVMLRTLNIQSRMACGFAGDEKGDAAGEYVFRGEHAHAWAEVYFGRYGWIRFDPSPLTYAEWRGEAGRKASWLAWIERIARYGGEDRAAVVSALVHLLRKSGWLLLLLSFSASVFFILRRRRAAGSWEGGSRSLRMPKAASFYGEFLRIAARAGIRRRPSWTPREMALAAGRVLPREPVRLVTEAYCALRYGNRGPDAAEEERIRQALAALRMKP